MMPAVSQSADRASDLAFVQRASENSDGIADLLIRFAPSWRVDL